MHCCSMSDIDCTLLVDLLFPNFVNILVSRLSFFVIILIVGSALLIDLLVLIRLNTFVSGLFDIFLGRSCCLVETLLDTLVLAGLSAVKCLQIGKLLSFAISFTLFML